MGFNAFLKIPHLISHVKGESNWIFNPRLITLHATLGVGGDREVLCPSLLFRGSMSETGSGEKCCAEPFYCVDGTRGQCSPFFPTKSVPAFEAAWK